MKSKRGVCDLHTPWTLKVKMIVGYDWCLLLSLSCSFFKLREGTLRYKNVRFLLYSENRNGFLKVSEYGGCEDEPAALAAAS